MAVMEFLLVGAAVALAAKATWSLGVLNDARAVLFSILKDAEMISLDPALGNKAEILFAYPGEFTY